METREEYLTRIAGLHPEMCECGDPIFRHGEKTKTVKTKRKWSATACWADRCACIEFKARAAVRA